MKSITLLILLAILISACAPSTQQIQAAIQKTQAVQTTATEEARAQTQAVHATGTEEAKQARQARSIQLTRTEEAWEIQATSTKAVESTKAAVVAQTKAVEGTKSAERAKTVAPTMYAAQTQLAKATRRAEYCDPVKFLVAWTELRDILGRVRDQMEVTARTERTALAPEIVNMQALARETKDLAVPPCMEKLKGLLYTVIDEHNVSQLLIMGNESDMVANAHLELTKKALVEMGLEIERLNKCVPDNCE